ncbi:sensor domain-containing protein [Saccharopolyspora sp. TS4A08]|uniref:histidine kinase n=1 Tax=Saccharopolyspora ipomoeae TaxID=3042027 RepID=A0ABT6PJD4_9PSEU|nr:sensor histidine kinase [Saccharopolyspora sp. TS4A08]MDI2028074.1 sensor domain-containing protein [Saccharopolyspora sp. TS4A08]
MWQRNTRARLTHRAHVTFDALEHVVGGLGTSVLALIAVLLVVVCAALVPLGVGIVLAPLVLRFAHVVAEQERTRLTRWGPDVIGPGPVPGSLVAALRARAVRRELAWVAMHAVTGFALGVVGLTLALNTVRDGTFPLWWFLLPPADATASLGLWQVRDVAGSLLVSLMGLGWVLACLVLLPGMARWQALPGRRLLGLGPEADLAMRVAHLTATRAAALDAHSAELRRIERSLHDGAQNRLVAVTVLVGAARRAVRRGPEEAEEMLGRAQDAAEQALRELRAVVRGLMPPVLLERSLPDALAALAADCPAECRIDADLPGRCAASVEASVYFAVAESLSNVAKHSGARTASVLLRRTEDDRLRVVVTDDGRGGADERGGSGLEGIRRRVEAHDGTFDLVSPVGGPTSVEVSLPCGL